MRGVTQRTLFACGGASCREVALGAIRTAHPVGVAAVCRIDLPGGWALRFAAGALELRCPRCAVAAAVAVTTR